MHNKRRTCRPLHSGKSDFPKSQTQQRLESLETRCASLAAASPHFNECPTRVRPVGRRKHLFHQEKPPRPSPSSSSSPFEAKMQSAHKPATASAGTLTSRSNICQLYNIRPLMNSQLKTPQTGAFSDGLVRFQSRGRRESLSSVGEFQTSRPVLRSVWPHLGPFDLVRELPVAAEHSL